jgi:hypothetical protein
VVVVGGVTDAIDWQTRLAGRLVTARATVPVKPFNGVTVIAEVPEAPANI